MTFELDAKVDLVVDGLNGGVCHLTNGDDELQPDEAAVDFIAVGLEVLFKQLPDDLRLRGARALSLDDHQPSSTLFLGPHVEEFIEDLSLQRRGQNLEFPPADDSASEPPGVARDAKPSHFE